MEETPRLKESMRTRIVETINFETILLNEESLVQLIGSYKNLLN
jgi:hypothetical protein